jgi:UDP-GlcNAc:undecaprenyl-phosphate GlcNAc-1-phosphate transferase
MALATFKYVLVFFGTLLLLRLLSRLAVRVGLVDYPGRRKRHRGAIPLIGGPAVLAGFCFGALMVADTLYVYRPLFAALGILLVAGLLDDLNDLSPAQKFLAQLAAGIVMISWGGMTVSHLGNLFGYGPVALHGIAFPITVVCLLGLINAMNMADGADGLASGLTLIAFAYLFVCAILIGFQVSAQLILTAFVALLAFWSINMRFPWQQRGKAFLGDSGSMMLGMLLTWFSVELAQPGSGFPPIAAVWFLAIPLLDMGVVIIRRLARKQSPFKAGRDHLHHVLIAAGLPPAVAVLAILALGLGLGAIGFAAWRAEVPDFVMFYAFVALLAVSIPISWQWRRILRHLNRFARRHRADGAGIA